MNENTKDDLLRKLQQQLNSAKPDQPPGAIAITINGNNTGGGHGIGNAVIKAEKVFIKNIFGKESQMLLYDDDVDRAYK